MSGRASIASGLGHLSPPRITTTPGMVINFGSKYRVKRMPPGAVAMEKASRSASRRDVVPRSVHLLNNVEHSGGFRGRNVDPEND